MGSAAHGKPEHDFHLVNPSPWPLATSFSLLGVTGGAVMWMHKYPHGGLIALASFLVVIICAVNWWRDVTREGRIDKAHTAVVSRGLRAGMALFIVSEVMFFVAFFWAFFSSALFKHIPITDDVWAAFGATGTWPPAGIKTFDAWDLPFMNTLVLLLSGTTVTWAHHALVHGNRKGAIHGLIWTVALGFSFTILQAIEYGHAAFSIKDGIYPSTFYLATGFHGLHVIIGTIFLAVCLFRIINGNMTSEKHLGFEFAAWYWHFVDVVWLFLFVWIYVWGS